MTGDARAALTPPPPPSLAALLRHERALPAQPDLVRARAVARARTSLRETPATPIAGRPTLARGASRLIFAAAAGMVFAGGVAVAFQMRHRAPAAGSSAPASPETSSLAGGPLPAAACAVGPRPGVGPLPAPALRSGNHRATSGNKRDSVTDEVQLLGRARACDARGDYACVLAVVAQHEHVHGAGRLTEEREVLRVKALVELGRASEARTAAARFQRDFPRSVLLHRVAEMQAGMP